MYKHIMVPVDLNEKGFYDKAIQHAVWIAEKSGAMLHLINVVPAIHISMVSSYFPLEASNKMQEDIRLQLEQVGSSLIPETIVYQLYIAEGKPYTTILDYAERLGIDLIIMPSHKRSHIDRMMLGSVANKVVENSRINVMVIKPTGSDPKIDD